MENQETLDLTEDLVAAVEEPNETKSMTDLMNVAYKDLTEDEKEYLISALKTRNNELEKIIKQAFNENKRINKLRDMNLTLMEDTLTFIKTEVGQCLGSVSLAIKNMEREVKNHGN